LQLTKKLQNIIAMALTFFKTPKNKKYNYKPVYYDQKKEEREKRLKAVTDDNPEAYAESLRDRLDLRWKRNAGARNRKASNQRLFVILLVMFLLLYLLFFL
jgi:cytochrome c-type biogenesis protein CcmH/NrfG